jgi:tetratricopeptide (TPR) repeat protein
VSGAFATASGESRRRYPGTGPFGPGDAALFFGRRRETEELYLRILSVPLLLQFGKSGLGKTSLLQAGLFPLLRDRPFLPVMIRLNDPRESLTDAVARSIRESVVNEGVDLDDDASAGLWELLAGTTTWREDLLLTPVLVFDQFEEVFTLRDQAFRDNLAAELGALATGIPPERLGASPVARPDVKLLISLKETHLGELEQFSARIPRLFQERLRLEPLSESEARDAVVEPARLKAKPGQPPYWTKAFTYDDNTLESMLTYLKGRSHVIEPFQLQLLCQHAEGIAQRKETAQSEPVVLTMHDFRGSNAFAVVLENFYRGVLRRIANPVERKRAAELCEDGLLGSSGQRLMLEKKQILSDYRLSENTLDVLGAERLVREERRMESTFYELSHDRLAESVFAARSERLPKSVKRAMWAGGAVALAIAALLVMGVLATSNRTVQKERDSAESLLGFLLGEQFMGEVRDVGRSTLLHQVQEQVDRRGVGMRSALNRGLSLRNRGEIRRTEGNVGEAANLFRESLKAFESAGDSPDAARELARAHDRLGNALMTQGKLTEALPHIEAADKYWRIMANTPGPADVVRSDCTSMAESLVTTVELRTRTGESARAQADLERTFTILSELLFGRGHALAECGVMAEQAAPYLRGAKTIAYCRTWPDIAGRREASAGGWDGCVEWGQRVLDRRPFADCNLEMSASNHGCARALGAGAGRAASDSAHQFSARALRWKPLAHQWLCDEDASPPRRRDSAHFLVRARVVAGDNNSCSIRGTDDREPLACDAFSTVVQPS